MHVYSIVGARPQFIKAAVVSHALQRAGIRETLIHTGQHYDGAMSQVFFDELGIPAPAFNLNVGSGTHATQTGAMMTKLEALVLQDARPDWIVVYGDTNSTLAGALVAAKLHIPVAHVEAGLRSFNRQMPEEINRIATDRLSTLLFCPTDTAVSHLAQEGMNEGVHMVGDVMLDATLAFRERAAGLRPLAGVTDLPAGGYYAATVHRAENTDDPERLQNIFTALGRLDRPVLLPLHPRTARRLPDIDVPGNVHLLEPLSYLQMLTLVEHAHGVLTDSGGLQKEAYWLGTPCVTLRDETEWVETTVNGWNHIVGADPNAILQAVQARPRKDSKRPLFGQSAAGRASTLIARTLLS